MKFFLTVVLSLSFSGAMAQDFSYPEIPASSKKVIGLVPANWIVRDSAWGDLNNDKVRDVALVLQYKDSIPFVNTGQHYRDTVITQPRMLVIASYNSKTKQYILLQQNNSFIPNHDQENMEDPYEDITISKDVLTLAYKIFMNAGGWVMSAYRYKFKYTQKEFLLIGADYLDMHRETGESMERSYNFLTRKVKVTTGNMESDQEKIKWSTIPALKLRSLKTLREPFNWQVEPGIFL